MQIHFYLCFYFSLFIILNVSELNATVPAQRTVERVCGKPTQARGSIIQGKDFKRGEFPWMVALLNKRKNPPQFLGAATLISTRHLITGKTQMQIKSSGHSLIRFDFESRSINCNCLIFSGSLHHAKTRKSL